MKDSIDKAVNQILDEEVDGGEEVSPEDVNIGDLVDFGAYGNLYILRTHQGSRGDKYWVTDQESERFNPDASGWYIRHYLARKVIEQADGAEDYEDENEYDD